MEFQELPCSPMVKLVQERSRCDDRSERH